uniref:Uncharacterized protein n=1 Tax=Romanomermis culicivorax TaxID=13658 RepID=A0A915KGK0_ROMCU
MMSARAIVPRNHAHRSFIFTNTRIFRTLDMIPIVHIKGPILYYHRQLRGPVLIVRQTIE